jgi:hypothetical protein
MNISKEEAQDSLADIEKVLEQTRRVIANGCSSSLLILWGVIWVIGYTGTQFYPARALYIWGPLNLAGGLASWYIGARATPIMDRGGWRIGLFWLALFVYAVIWVVLLAPARPERLGAYFGTVPMFAYVVGGFWLGRFFTWLGMIVTALILGGVFLLPQWMNLWIGILGGGSLVVSGLYIRRCWR